MLIILLNVVMCWVSAYIAHDIGFTGWYGVPLVLTLTVVHVHLFVALIIRLMRG